MEAHALIGMPRNLGAKMQRMNGVNLNMSGAMSILLVRVHKKQFTSEIQNMRES